MVEEDRCSAAFLGLHNAEVLHAGIENLLLPDGLVNVVITNGVFNLWVKLVDLFYPRRDLPVGRVDDAGLDLPALDDGRGEAHVLAGDDLSLDRIPRATSAAPDGRRGWRARPARPRRVA
jgi:hypothetical protein